MSASTQCANHSCKSRRALDEEGVAVPRMESTGQVTAPACEAECPAGDCRKLDLGAGGGVLLGLATLPGMADRVAPVRITDEPEEVGNRTGRVAAVVLPTIGARPP